MELCREQNEQGQCFLAVLIPLISNLFVSVLGSDIQRIGHDHQTNDRERQQKLLMAMNLHSH